MSTEAIRRIEEIKARADKATPGPWEYWDEDHNDIIAAMVNKDDGVPILALAQLKSRPHDFKFVAAARSDVPALCQALRIAIETINDVGDGCAVCNEAMRQIEEVLK